MLCNKKTINPKTKKSCKSSTKQSKPSTKLARSPARFKTKLTTKNGFQKDRQVVLGVDAGQTTCNKRFGSGVPLASPSHPKPPQLSPQSSPGLWRRFRFRRCRVRVIRSAGRRVPTTPSCIPRRPCTAAFSSCRRLHVPGSIAPTYPKISYSKRRIIRVCAQPL